MSVATFANVRLHTHSPGGLFPVVKMVMGLLPTEYARKPDIHTELPRFPPATLYAVVGRHKATPPIWKQRRENVPLLFKRKLQGGSCPHIRRRFCRRWLATCCKSLVGPAATSLWEVLRCYLYSAASAFEAAKTRGKTTYVPPPSFTKAPARSSSLLTLSAPSKANIPKFALSVSLLRAPASAPILPPKRGPDISDAGEKYRRPLLKSFVHRLHPGRLRPVAKMFPPPPPGAVNCRLSLHISPVPPSLPALVGSIAPPFSALLRVFFQW